MALYHHDLQSLRLFVAICHLRSVSRAAEQFNLAISAASRRLRLLEDEVGAALVTRMAHGVEPTMAGLTTLRYAESVLRLADGLAASMSEHHSGVRGRVRVSASSSALVHRLAGDLAEFVHNHPDIRIDLEERPSGETITQMARGQADIGVFIRGVPISGLQVWPYAQDRLSLAVYPDHRLAENDSIQFRDLLNDEFVALEVGSAIYRLMAEKAREQGRYLRIRVQVRSFEVMCQMIRSGLGIGILPEGALRPLAHALGLKLIRLEEDWAIRHIDIGVHAGYDIAPPTKRLLQALGAVDFS